MSLRPAVPADVTAITRIVDAAYAHYIPRIGRKPGPMQDDHAARVRAGEAFVLEAGGTVAGVLVLIDQPDHLLLDNVAVDPARRGSGLGRTLLQFAEAEARRRGHPEIRLYTHVTMTENIGLYARIGYRETGRGTQAGFERVFFAKPVAAGVAGEMAG
jgi:ribosomal protein S18 acetylase RimI-like enzyme